MKGLRKIKYPKLFLLISSFILAYYIFQSKDLTQLHTFLLGIGYIGTFISGMFFSYGFTAASGTAILLIIAKSQNIFLASIIGGLGALCADLILFQVLRHSFTDEMKKLSREKFVKEMNKRTPKKVKKYLLLIVAGFIITSPLPDEIGVTLLAASQTVSKKIFALLSFVLNTCGIFVILLIGRML